MATYPALPQCEGTRLVPRSGVRLRYASNGDVHARALSSAARYDPVVVHRGLTAAQWSTLKSFYESNRAVVFVLEYAAAESLTLNCLFADRPFEVEPRLGNTFDVTVTLAQAD